MTITPWITIQGVKYEKLIIAILSCVRSSELSMEEMCDEFKKFVELFIFMLGQEN